LDILGACGASYSGSNPDAGIYHKGLRSGEATEIKNFNLYNTFLGRDLNTGLLVKINFFF
jgi:hypothetical protein